VSTGTAKLRVRLGDNEDIDTVKSNFLRAGLSVQEAKSNPNKKPVFTYQQTLMERSPQRQTIDAKLTKVTNL